MSSIELDRAPSAPISPLLRRGTAQVLLGLVLVVGLVEFIAGLVVHQPRTTESDWEAVAGALDPELSVLVAADWLGPEARMHLSAAATPDAVAPPDLWGLERFHVLAPAGRSPWRGRLGTELDGLAAPAELGLTHFGGLDLYTFESQGPHLLTGLIDRWEDPGLRLSAGPSLRCRRQNNRFKCRRGAGRAGEVRVEYAEIDFQPRRCVVVDLVDGARFSATLPDATFGELVRGHVGFPDFNARLRGDGPVTLTLRQDREVLGRWTFTDDMGWAPFVVATSPGRGELEVELQTSSRATFGPRGPYGEPGAELGRRHPVCLELRTLDSVPEGSVLGG